MYEEKSHNYFSICRSDLLACVPHGSNNRILEIGAGSGDTLLKAKETGRAAYVAGVELNEITPGNQTHPALDRFIIGNIEELELDFEDGFFDVILCGDVLEHLVDPWSCLERLRPLLKDGGVMIASIPNVRYWKVSMGLLFCGRWSYADAGILDRSHLRFFVKQSVETLFTQAGFSVVNMDARGPQREWGFSAWALNLLTLGWLADLLTVQYLIVAATGNRPKIRD